MNINYMFNFNFLFILKYGPHEGGGAGKISCIQYLQQLHSYKNFFLNILFNLQFFAYNFLNFPLKILFKKKFLIF